MFFFIEFTASRGTQGIQVAKSSVECYGGEPSGIYVHG